jgi:hypothetical protein
MLRMTKPVSKLNLIINKKSVNHKFLDDFEIEYDYRYLNEFDKILIESSTPTNHDVYIKNFFY